jgi:transposase
MRKPIYVRTLTQLEREAVEAGLRSSDAFTLRRCQIVLASSRGKRASQIAQDLSCDGDTVTKAINAFNERGLEALSERSHAVHTPQAVFAGEAVERLKAIVRQSPRNFAKETSLWTLDLVAEVSFEQGLTPERVSDETIRNTLKRLGIQWKRAKQWITSPDPAYERKKRSRPTDCTGRAPSGIRFGLPRRDLVEPGDATDGARLGGRRPGAAPHRAGVSQRRP